MDLRKLKTLIDMVAESSITELEVTEAGETIKIVKGNNTPHQGQNMMVGTHAPMHFAPAQALTAMPSASNAAPQEVPALVVKPAEGKVIKSPMVGTFYAASGPDKPDFVTVGADVKANQTVCIIEAMKLLNEIEAGIEGAIVEILVKNGTPVEFGQPLFIVA
jgi:acetyl-CoA carboxylase biotin carboxyl carrier protein